ncbi:DoxX family protein [Microtetraspora sp. AC03309]|uniref:DoxX family protein n=1 Tax=Microtetraspora sp. AC03309 TaxID=2779376 RepID=UPI001E5B8553|nr:DoxX family protein [Microtetraspora sp. AC03309]MCC5580802.1 DoxX family protein [Microtetraspora sp. AC03309]
MKRTLHDVASLAARMGVGGIFFANGWQKLEAGLTATGAQFAELGAPMPAIWAAATMLIELVGGTLLIAGLAVPFVGLLLFAEAVAVFVITTGQSGMPLTGGDIKLIVALGAASVLLSVGGAGRVSVDHMVVIKRREAEAADEFAADKEADAVIAALREPEDASKAIGPGTAGTGTARDAGTSASTGGSAGGPATGGPKGPVTFPASTGAPGSSGGAADAPGSAGGSSASGSSKAPGGAGQTASGASSGTSSSTASGTASSTASGTASSTASGRTTGKAAGKASSKAPGAKESGVKDSRGAESGEASDTAPRSRLRRTKRGTDESTESRSEAPAGPEPGDTLVAGRRPKTS